MTCYLPLIMSLFLASQNRAPVVTIHDPVPPPATLAAAWQESDVVVRVRVGNSKPVLETRALTPFVRRQHDVSVAEVFKDSGLLRGRSRFVVSQTGGTVIDGGREFVTEYDSDLLEPNTDAIVFLLYNARTDTFNIAFGGAGIYRISNEAVAINAAAQRMTELRGRLTVDIESFRALMQKSSSKH